ncbi:angiotensin-converting enzyme-like protein [Leptotrombidium deliense]|uniref:Angiotensin-converting enzyme n=1 Tax=Leptotrombidium deliense TaxID=299467 RepID=A0A443S6Z1_9ACAR|nr:angiotensin-converting enzyme-like protein [Leptotrombidium deliense]
MEALYGSAKVCVKGKCGLSLDPDLTKLMATNRDYDTLLEAWVNWRDASGKQIRDMYPQYVEFGNEVAKKNSDNERVFNDYGDWLLYPFEEKNFKQDLENVWKEIEPFYKQLHTYVRLRLKRLYGERMPNDGTIPAHLLGNMWAQKWDNLREIVTAFADAPQLDVTQVMIDNQYNATNIFKLAEQFFVGIGLNAMPDTFWSNSMLEKPNDREVMCHATSWDFCDGKDYRSVINDYQSLFILKQVKVMCFYHSIRQCTQTTMEHLITAHHEMGHTEYFMAYKDKPYVFREGANPGFIFSTINTLYINKHKKMRI